MSRPLRLEYPGAFYHIISRGDRRGAIYLNDADRLAFNQLASDVVARRRWRIHAWCQMTNHYHLLVETPEPNLAQGMRQLNGGYANYFNHTHNRVGHVFQGRYTAINVQREQYLLELARYVVLNPVRVGMVAHPQDWTWSSYCSTSGLRQPDPWLTTDLVLALFGRKHDTAVERYRRFVDEGVSAQSPWVLLRNGIFLGDERFVEELLTRHARAQPFDEIPKQQTRQSPKSLIEWESCSTDRNTAMALAYESGAYTLKQIASHFGLHYSRVSRIVKAVKMVQAKGKT